MKGKSALDDFKMWWEDMTPPKYCILKRGTKARKTKKKKSCQ